MIKNNFDFKISVSLDEYWLPFVNSEQIINVVGGTRRKDRLTVEAIRTISRGALM